MVGRLGVDEGVLLYEQLQHGHVAAGGGVVQGRPSGFVDVRAHGDEAAGQVESALEGREHEGGFAYLVLRVDIQPGRVLTALGHNVKETVIDAGYDVEAEIEKFLWMDAVIWQMPGWWMHEPWTVKKYIDEVLTAGHGKLYHSDGRHRVNPTEGYGTGGLLQGKKHMLSLTWNAPIEAFTREGDFFEGKGVDALYMHFHKLNEFIGLTRLPTFLCNDVIKNPQVEQYLADYQAHLEKVFG